MATPLENLKTRRQDVTDELVAFTQRPTYSADGQSVQWESYRRSLIDELEKLNELINLMDPFELSTLMT